MFEVNICLQQALCYPNNYSEYYAGYFAGGVPGYFTGHIKSGTA